MTKVKREISSGGVLYRMKDRNIEVVLISRTTQRGENVWCLPKGKVEKNEESKETALREVREETGIKGEIEGEIGSINYWFYSSEDKSKIFKTVHFYLMKYKSGSVKEHDWEVEEVKWFNINRAIEILSYKTEKEVLEKARKILNSIPGG